MHLNPYGQDPVDLAVNLSNRPVADLDDLVRRCVDAGVVVDMPVGPADLDAARELVARFRDIVDATDERHRAALVNALLRESAAHPRLTDHAGGWHLHYRDDDLTLSGVLRALVSVGTALHLSGRGMHRLGRCTDRDCDLAYADFSRTGRQRYCSTRCANRDAVRRHRSALRSA
jgi:predicted RNA-binding Zn ribbon-like protein